jgi:hypothetical protein
LATSLYVLIRRPSEQTARSTTTTSTTIDDLLYLDDCNDCATASMPDAPSAADLRDRLDRLDRSGLITSSTGNLLDDSSDLRNDRSLRVDLLDLRDQAATSSKASTTRCAAALIEWKLCA